jgi:uncharacterized protein
MLQTLRNPEGEVLDFTLHMPSDGPLSGHGPLTTVVIGHGVTANKDRPWARALADALAAAGHAALRFSFSGNGLSEGAFEESCPTKQVRDLGAVLDAVRAHPALGEAPLVYVGHSMGAAVGVLRASLDERLAALVSLAGMVDTEDFARRKFGSLVPGEPMWDKPECPLSQAFLDDMRAIGSVEHLAERIEIPWLLIHGTADLVVPYEESERMAARAAGSVELILLDGADHVFEAPHAQTVAAEVADWLDARFG